MLFFILTQLIKKHGINIHSYYITVFLFETLQKLNLYYNMVNITKLRAPTPIKIAVIRWFHGL